MGARRYARCLLGCFVGDSLWDVGGHTLRPAGACSADWRQFPRRLTDHGESSLHYRKAVCLCRYRCRGDQSLGRNGVGRLFQTRLESRFNIVIAAALTALPFACVHMPLLLIGEPVSAISVLRGVAGLLVLGVGILHSVFNASNNDALQCQQQRRWARRLVAGRRRSRQRDRDRLRRTNRCRRQLPPVAATRIAG